MKSQLGSEAPMSLGVGRDEVKTFRGLQHFFNVETWNRSLCFIFLGLIISFFLFGYWNPYWRNADMDFMITYQAFLLNDGRPQDFFDHPGHLNILLIDTWFRLLHSLGLLDVAALSDIPNASDAVGFERAWTAAVRAGRLLSLLIALSFVGVFAALIRSLISDWRIAAFATFMLAFSTGVMYQARIMRTELLSGGLEILGLLLLLIAARSRASSFRPVIIGIAALLCTLGVVNKVQGIFMVACWPAVILFFGSRVENPAWVWRDPKLAIIAIVASAAPILLAVGPAAELFRIAFFERSTSISNFPPPPFGVIGLYQTLLAGYVGAAVIVYARIWRVSLLETVATLEMVALAVMVGLLVVNIRYHPQNALIVFNFLEQMLVWATNSDPGLGSGGGIFSMRFLQSVAAGLYEVFAHATFVLHPSSRASMFLQWFIFAGIYMAWKRGHRLLVGQVAMLLAAAWFIDLAATFRGAKIDYIIFGDSVIVVAAAWLFGNMPELTAHRLAFPIGVTLLATQLVFGQAQAIRTSFLLRRSPERTCEWVSHYVKLIERFPYCPPKT
jgi:hypothetical protein